MNCPVCDGRLRPVGKHGVEVDICPDCKGMWLDRGELDKILAMGKAEGFPGEQRSAAPPAPASPERSPERYRDDDDEERGERGGYGSRSGKPKRRSWFEDIFDSFGGE